MSDLIDILGNEFWEYSCSQYDNIEVKNACLNLQNNFQADVNILLFLCWSAHKGNDVGNEKTIKSIIKTSKPWQHDVVEPLRQLRKQIGKMKGNEAKNVKASLLRSELEAEKSEQFALVGTLLKTVDKKILSQSKSAKKTKAKETLETYMQLIGKKQCNQQISDQLDILLSQVFK